jgi:opacity protein-like surface antigen
MKMRWLLAVSIVGVFALAQGVRAESVQRFGVGVNYWRMMDDIDVHNIDNNGVSWLLTYQYKLSNMVKVEADLEVFPDGFPGFDDTTCAPEVYLVVGSTIYAAAGVGILYSDGDFANNPFFALRAGLDVEIIPRIYLDLNVNYRFADSADLSDPDTNIAALRYEF